MSIETAIKSIVFDMDGVLSDTSPIHAAAYEKLWQRIEISGPEYITIAGRSTHDVVREITRPLKPSTQQLADWINYKQTHALHVIQKTNTVYAEVPPILRLLVSRDIPCSVATSASLASTIAILTRANIIDLFTEIVTAEDVSEAKPSPQGFLLAMQKSQFSLSSTLIIEDSTSGIEAAIASGAQVCSIRTGAATSHDRFLGAFPNLTQVLEILL